MSRIPKSEFTNRQRGAALAVSLILLVVITIIGLASIRGTNMQERMSANMYDRNLAFQAAETGLRTAEARLTPPLALPVFGAACPGGFCSEPKTKTEWATAETRAFDPDGSWWAADNTALGALITGAASRPEFVVEDMGEWPEPPECQNASPVPPDCFAKRYRISAQYLSAGRANVVLQTMFRRQ